jgi:MoxR-like ATPase
MFKLQILPPPADDMRVILDRASRVEGTEIKPIFQLNDLIAVQRTLGRVPIANHVRDYCIKLYRATHPDSPEAGAIAKQYVRYGVSPRGAQALISAGRAVALLRGRFNVGVEDIQKQAIPALRHRIVRNFDAEANGVTTDMIVQKILEETSQLPAR